MRRAAVLTIVEEQGRTPTCSELVRLLAAKGISVSRSHVSKDLKALGLARRPKRKDCVATLGVAGLCSSCRRWITDIEDGRAHLPEKLHGIFCGSCCPTCSDPAPPPTAGDAIRQACRRDRYGVRRREAGATGERRQDFSSPIREFGSL